MLRVPALAAASLVLACGSDPQAETGFTSTPVTTHTSPSSSSTSTSSSSSSGEASGSGSAGGSTTSTGTEDSAASASSTNGVADLGVVPDFGGHPPGCQGKIDFLFVISSDLNAAKYQGQLKEAFPAFIDLIKSDFADFDYRIMTIDAGTNATMSPKCNSCWMCDWCDGCVPFGGPSDYPCDVEPVVCDLTSGAGVVLVGNFGGSNKRCELAGGNRFITKEQGQGESLYEAFECTATLGAGPKTPVPMEALMAAIEPDMLGKDGCNAGFIRPDALLVVVVLNETSDTLSWGAPWSWYQALVKTKQGNEDALVVLVISNDSEVEDPVCPPVGGDNPLRLLAQKEAKHGRFDSSCRASYVPFLKESAELVLDQCSLLIPQ